MTEKLRIAFAVTSVVLLLVLAVSPLKDFFSPWRNYQRRYNEYLGRLPRRIPPVELGIKQSWIPALDQIDRCETCHLGIGEPALAPAPEPFSTHPTIPHDPSEFGCVTCHQGQGQATTVADAHSGIDSWEIPVIPVQYIESSCGKCHKEAEVPSASILTQGRALIADYHCAGCHAIGGTSRKWIPDLDGVGSKVSRQWLVDWLKNPREYYQQTRMPDFLLPDAEAAILADFLMTSRSFADTATLLPLPSALRNAKGAALDQLIALGRTRVSEARCITCHSINGRGGSIANDLGKVASKVNEEWLYNYIRDPKRLQPGVEMPRYRFSEKELEAVTAYIESDFIDPNPPSPEPVSIDPSFHEKGLALFKKYDCGGCHHFSGAGPGESAPDLSAIGSKHVYEIEFGTSGIERTLPSYIDAKLLHPRIFSSGMKMPDFGFSDEQARAITTALLASSGEQMPQRFIVPPKPVGTFRPQGKFGMLADDLACLACHSMFGRGGKVAPDLSIEAGMVQPKWIGGYLKVPYSLRPTLTERMPNFFLSEKEIQEIVDYLAAVCVNDTLTVDVPTGPQDVAEGRNLYFEKYGCQSCHQIATKGGYVGPPLDDTGRRLNPGWIVDWLLNPQSFKPGTLEPKSGMSSGEAKKITAFLMTLRSANR